MKKLFMIFAIILAIALICVAAISLYDAPAPGKSEKPESAEKDISSADEDQLKDYRLDAISKLEKLERTDDPTRRFPYLEEMAAGTVGPEAPKLDLETARGIVSKNGEFSKIRQELEKIQPYPDCVYGSGVTWVEYWFDETGDEKLAFLLEQSQIYYFSLDADGNRNIEALYDPHR